jgi:hypothetical protein
MIRYFAVAGSISPGMFKSACFIFFYVVIWVVLYFCCIIHRSVAHAQVLVHVYEFGFTSMYIACASIFFFYGAMIKKFM